MSVYPRLPKLPPRPELSDLRPFEREILEDFKRFAFVEGRGGRSSPRKGRWVRGHLLSVETDYLYGMWLKWKRFVELARRLDVKLAVGQYGAFRTYCWLLTQEKLIVKVGTEKSSRGGFPRSYYRLVEENLDSPLWLNPYRKYH